MALSKPTQMTVPFASSGQKNAIPTNATGTNRASMREGFPAVTMLDINQGGLPPYGEDVNGILFDVTTAIRYIEAGGLFPYNSSFASAISGYPLGALLTSADGKKLYQNQVAGNTSNPDNNGSNWKTIDIANVSSSSVTATGSTTSRTLADRFADVINVKDYGAKGDGVTDDTTAKTAAMTAAGGRSVFYPTNNGEDYGLSLNNFYGNYNTALLGLSLSGSLSSPTSNPAPSLFIGKYTSANRNTNPYEWDNGAIYGQLTKVSGDAYGSAVTGFARSLGKGDMIGIHGRGYALGKDSSVWGGWFFGTLEHADANSAIGVEINVANKVADFGYMTSNPSPGITRGLIITTDISPYTCSIALSISARNAQALDASGNHPDTWYTGLVVKPNTVYPNKGTAIGEGEAFFINGGSIPSWRYGGVRFSGYFHYGLSFVETTCHNNAAIILKDGQGIAASDGADSTADVPVGRGLYFDRTNNILNARGFSYAVNGTKVVGEQRTGWANYYTGTRTRDTFDTSTITTAELAERVVALIDDLKTHGLIGV